MTKQEVSQMVLQDGKPLSMDKFSWDKKARVFSTTESWLVVDFRSIDNCTFRTGHYCTFVTGHYCTFDTVGCCTFNTGNSCTFKTGSNCVVIRRGVHEVIELEEGVKIKLNGYGIKGYKTLKDTVTLTFEGRNVEISRESAKALGLIAGDL